MLRALGNPEVFEPAHVAAALSTGNALADRGARWATVFARLRRGVSLDRAQTLLHLEAARLAEHYPQYDPELAVRAVPAGTFAGLLGARVQPLVMRAELVWGVGLLLLLIALANCANLFLARAIGRLHEVAVRAALGASLWRLARQLLTEGLLVSVAGSLIGAGLGVAVLHLGTLLPDLRSHQAALDWRVLAYTGILLAGATLLFGLSPLAIALDANLMKQLQVRRAVSNPRARRSRRLLAIAQVALSAALLVGAGLMLRTLVALERVNLGFDPSGLLVTELLFPRGAPPSVLQLLHRKVESLPGVKAVGFGDQTPLDGFQELYNVEVPGYVPRPGEAPEVELIMVFHGYFRALGVPLIRGHGFEEVPSTQNGVAVINEAMARRYWPGRNPIGCSVVLHAKALRVIGVVGDVREENPWSAPEPTLYLPHPAQAVVSPEMLVRAEGGPASRLSHAIQHVIRETLPEVPEATVQPASARLQAMLAPREEVAAALGIFGALGLLVASIGLFSVSSYAVATRRMEFGVRMAMGATPGDVLRLVLFETVRGAAAGILAGLLVSGFEVRLLAHFLFGVSPLDPASLSGAVLLLLACALLAGAAPAWRASRLPLAQVLREE